MDETNLIYEEALRVQASDCDVKRQAKPAALFRYLSEAAGVHAARLGVGYSGMVARGVLWVHARMAMRFDRYPHAGDQVILRTWPRPVERRLLYPRDFELLDARGELLVAATSAWLIVDATTHRIVRPGSIDLDVPAIDRSVGLEAAPPRGSEEIDAESGEARLTVRAGYSAIDMLGHVNNSRYVEWLCDAFPPTWHRDHDLDWLQIAYTHEVLPGEEVAIHAAQSPSDPGLWAVAGRNQANDTRAFEAQVRWRER